jgi:hypothetical protein
MAIKIGKPPKVNWKAIHGQIAFEYSTKISTDSMDVRARASVKKRVSAHGLDVVSDVITFFNAWLNEDKWRNENMRFKGIGSFFAFKFDEMKKIMDYRNSQKPTYVDLSKAGDAEGFVDPFKH